MTLLGSRLGRGCFQMIRERNRFNTNCVHRFIICVLRLYDIQVGKNKAV